MSDKILSPEEEQAAIYLAERLFTNYECWIFSDYKRSQAVDIVARALLSLNLSRAAGASRPVEAQTEKDAQQLDTREREMELALRNCRMLAQREIRNYEGGGQKPTGVKTFAAWKHIIRFCEEAGVSGSILRLDDDTQSDKEKA